MGGERRQSGRVAYPCEVECQTSVSAASVLNPRISDLSVDGAFIDTMTPAPAGTLLELRFRAPEEIRLRAEVVNSMPQFGMGVRFLEPSADQRALLEKVIAARG